MRVFIVAGLAASITLAGCTTDPYTGESKVSNTAWGAGIGAVAGAALGAATGKNAADRRERALKVAAVGGAIGGGVGAYMDYQEKKLRERLQNVGVSIERNKQTGEIKLIMPGNITFPTKESAIKSDFYPVLDAVGDVLKEYNKTMVRIDGYTDSVGKDDSNLQLSRDRASSVANYLINRGINSERLDAEGHGKANPIGDNKTDAGRAANRRVELTIEPPPASNG